MSTHPEAQFRDDLRSLAGEVDGALVHLFDKMEAQGLIPEDDETQRAVFDGIKQAMIDAAEQRLTGYRLHLHATGRVPLAR